MGVQVRLGPEEDECHMPSFEEMFTESAGRPIQYHGMTLVRMDAFPLEAAKELRLVFEACNAEWRQGVALRCEGKFKVNEQIIRRGIVIWQDTAPKVIEIGILGTQSTIEVKNVWEIDEVVQSSHNGAAMIVEETPNGRRYRCNDGVADDDFDDIVFRLERVGDDDGQAAKPRGQPIQRGYQ